MRNTFMTMGGVKVGGIDDVEEFQATKNTMKVTINTIGCSEKRKSVMNTFVGREIV